MPNPSHKDFRPDPVRPVEIYDELVDLENNLDPVRAAKIDAWMKSSLKSKPTPEILIISGPTHYCYFKQFLGRMKR